ncbi:unnamed protein product [Sympodiomycopsis kandeliae]
MATAKVEGGPGGKLAGTASAILTYKQILDVVRSTIDGKRQILAKQSQRNHTPALRSIESRLMRAEQVRRAVTKGISLGYVAAAGPSRLSPLVRARRLTNSASQSTSNSTPPTPTLRQLLDKSSRSKVPSELTPKDVSDLVPVTLTGWIRVIRAHSRVVFFEVTDGSLPGSDTLQAVLTPKSAIEKIMTDDQWKVGAAVRLTGHLKDHSKHADKQEFLITHGQIVGPNDPDTHPILNASADALEVFRQNAHLRPRHPVYASILRTRSRLESGMSQWFEENDFIKVNPPIMTASDCEGAGEVFRVTGGLKEDEGQEDTSGSSQSYLTVSSQLHLEALTSGLGRVYTFTPVFRAEDSATNRHLREFWMCEAEMMTQAGLAQSELLQVMNIVEQSIKNGVQGVLSRSSAELKLQCNSHEDGVDYETRISELQHLSNPQMPWPVMTYTEALESLSKQHLSEPFTQPPPEWGENLPSEHEKWLARNGPIFITDYPSSSKPFYMRLNDDKKTVAAFDLLFPKIGEIAGGSLRENSIQVLLERMTELNLLSNATIEKDHPLYWYIIELRKFGLPPHGGFGIGMERLVSWITGTDSVRECIPFPRVGRKIRF